MYINTESIAPFEAPSVHTTTVLSTPVLAPFVVCKMSDWIYCKASPVCVPLLVIVPDKPFMAAKRLVFVEYVLM